MRRDHRLMFPGKSVRGTTDALSETLQLTPKGTDHMELGDLLVPEGVMPSLKARTKKQVLLELAQRAAELTGLSARDIYDTLQQRESLGSTGFGRGIAIPHVKLKSLKKIMCLFARAEVPVDFESMDGEPVDLFFLLLAPEHAGGDHLKALARISRLLREPHAIDRLRACDTADQLRVVLTAPATPHAA